MNHFTVRASRGRVLRRYAFGDDATEFDIIRARHRATKHAKRLSYIGARVTVARAVPGFPELEVSA